MNDTSADAQVALGAVLYLGDWNWIGARRSLEPALELNPNHTEGHLLLRDGCSRRWGTWLRTSR